MNAALTAYRPETMPVGGASLASATANPANAASTSMAKPAAGASTTNSTHGGFGFSDVLAILNPLQHIPVVGTLYREWTGDTISPAARIAGDTLYGGVIGLAVSVADTVVEGETGKDFGAHVYDTLFGEDTPPTPATAPAATGVTLAPAASIGATISATPGTAGAQAAPGSFMASMQHGGAHKHAVPLATTVPVAIPHPGEQATATAALSQAEAANAALANAAQQSTNAYGALGKPAARPNALGATSPAGRVKHPIQRASCEPATEPLAATPQADVSNLMQALDKYKTMAKQNGISGNAVSLTN